LAFANSVFILVVLAAPDLLVVLTVWNSVTLNEDIASLSKNIEKIKFLELLKFF